MLDDTEDVIEVFCEHHEDVLVKQSDGNFTGLQVKSRASDQVLWKANDAAVINSCCRFAKLEAMFPGNFRAFRFLTNHPLFADGNAKSLVHALTGVWPRAADLPYSSVLQAARHLEVECGRASSLAHQEILPAYFVASVNPQELELHARLSGKKMNRLSVLRLLDRGLDDPALLTDAPEHCVAPGTGSTNLLFKKLNAGGFSAVSLNSAENLHDKADYLGLVWTSKYGSESTFPYSLHSSSFIAVRIFAR